MKPTGVVEVNAGIDGEITSIYIQTGAVFQGPGLCGGTAPRGIRDYPVVTIPREDPVEG